MLFNCVKQQGKYDLQMMLKELPNIGLYSILVSIRHAIAIIPVKQYYMKWINNFELLEDDDRKVRQGRTNLEFVFF